MGLNARQGATITISAEGDDEREAVQALSDLAASDFSTAE
jgi:phosphotransferase system HPr-like phosphotransfer protein